MPGPRSLYVLLWVCSTFRNKPLTSKRPLDPGGAGSHCNIVYLLFTRAINTTSVMLAQHHLGLKLFGLDLSLLYAAKLEEQPEGGNSYHTNEVQRERRIHTELAESTREG